jgi:hypothetical protein
MPLDIMYEKVSAFQLFCCLSHHNNQKASNDFHRWLLAPHFLTLLVPLLFAIERNNEVPESNDPSFVGFAFNHQGSK